MGGVQRITFNFLGSVLFPTFHHVRLGNWTQDIRLSIKPLYPPNHPGNEVFFIKEKKKNQAAGDRLELDGRVLAWHATNLGFATNVENSQQRAPWKGKVQGSQCRDYITPIQKHISYNSFLFLR